MYEYKAKIIEFISADNLIAEVDLGFGIKRKKKLKLHGIKAKSENSKSARDCFYSLTEDKKIILQVLKYNDYSAIIKVREENSEVHVNHELVRLGYADYIN